MANPVEVACPADTWTAVATGVSCGRVNLKNRGGAYKFTYREAGGAAPTDDEDSQMVVSRTILISHSSPIDVYIKSIAADGSVLVVL